MCKKYAKDYNLVFLKSAQEIASHIKYCKTKIGSKYHTPIRRCVLNRYNQGTFYKTRSKCSYTHKCSRLLVAHYYNKDHWYRAYRSCKKARAKCRNIAAYWVKLSCFEYGARNKIQTKRYKRSKRRKSCRRCFRYKDIHKFYPTKIPKPSTPKKATKTPLTVSSR
jgi:hypothetical protein